MFTDNVQSLAIKNGITVAKMLKDLNMGQGTFSTWKARGTIPSGEILAKIADYFGVTVDYLLGGTENPEPGKQKNVMFKKRFIKLCNEKNVSPTKACKDIGLSSAAFSTWSDNTVPRIATLEKFADYFGVTTAYLLNGDSDKEKTTDLEEKGRQAEFVDLFSQLTPEQQKMLMAQMKGLLSE